MVECTGCEKRCCASRFPPRSHVATGPNAALCQRGGDGGQFSVSSPLATSYRGMGRRRKRLRKPRRRLRLSRRSTSGYAPSAVTTCIEGFAKGGPARWSSGAGSRRAAGRNRLFFCGDIECCRLRHGVGDAGAARRVRPLRGGGGGGRRREEEQIPAREDTMLVAGRCWRVTLRFWNGSSAGTSRGA